MSSSSHRPRIQGLRSRLSSQQQPKQQQSSQEQVDRMSDIKVIIPPSLCNNDMGLTRNIAEAGLRPLQTNTRKPLSNSQNKEKLKPLQQVIKNNPIDPVNQRQADHLDGRKQKAPAKGTTYKLVEDKDVPLIIKDHKRKLQYRKLECLGFVSEFSFFFFFCKWQCINNLYLGCIR